MDSTCLMARAGRVDLSGDPWPTHIIPLRAAPRRNRPAISLGALIRKDAGGEVSRDRDADTAFAIGFTQNTPVHT